MPSAVFLDLGVEPRQVGVVRAELLVLVLAGRAAGLHGRGLHVAGDGSPAEDEDEELSAYNAYLARLNAEVKDHGRWHGLR